MMHVPLVYVLAAFLVAWTIFLGAKITRGSSCENPMYMVLEIATIGVLVTLIPSPIARVIGEFLMAFGSFGSFGAWFALFECINEKNNKDQGGEDE